MVNLSNYTKGDRGIDPLLGELCDYLGDTDIGQVRYFNKPTDMWQMLGFEDSGFKYYFIMAAFLIFGVLMLGFGIQSLYRLRSMK